MLDAVTSPPEPAPGSQASPIDPLEARPSQLLGPLTASGGVAPLATLAGALRDELPHDASDAARRGSEALVRAVAEASTSLVMGRLGAATWVATSADRISVVKALGEAADSLSQREPLLAFEAASTELTALVVGTSLAGVAPETLVNLAAAASTRAALSARLELYPRGMPAARALRLSAGALASPRLEGAEIRRVVGLRYPQAEPLPEADDDLTRLLEPLGFERSDHLFVRKGAAANSTTGTDHLPTRQPTRHVTRAPVVDPGEQEKIEFKNRLQSAARSRSFSVLEVAAAYADQAAPYLSDVLGSPPVSLDAAILVELDDVIREREIEDPSIIVETDRKGPDGSEDWSMLTELVREAALRVTSRLAKQRGTLLLTQPGILGRYQLDEPLHALLRATQDDDGPGVFLLVPSYAEAHAAPVIDAPGRPLAIPLSSPAQRIRVPDRWISND